jgi:hypothetical protein
MARVTTDLVVFSDYKYIEIKDGDSETLPWDDGWTSNKWAVAEDAAAIVTGVLANVHVAVEVCDAPPVDDSEQFATVYEFSMRVDSGKLTVTSCTLVDPDQVPVPSGWLRFRVSLPISPHEEELDLDEDELDDPENWRRVRIQCWPAERADRPSADADPVPILIKG